MTVCSVEWSSGRPAGRFATLTAALLVGAAILSPLMAAEPATYAAGEAALLSWDFSTALRILAPLAEAGDARAQNDIGVMYGKGLGVSEDPVLAYAWYGVASAGGDQVALRLRERLAARLSDAQIARARELARDLHVRFGAPGQPGR